MTSHLLRGSCALALLTVLLPAAVAQRNPSGVASPRLYQVSPAGGKAGTAVEVVVAGKHLEDAERLVFSHPGIKGEVVPAEKPEVDPKTKKPKPVKDALPAEHFKFKVTVAADVPRGNHDVRLVNKWGVSNPRVFVVGDLTEVAEKEPNNDVDAAQKVALNTTVNGTILNPTDVDYYVFPAKKGQRVVLSCLASSIDSRLQPQLEVYDARDRQLAFNRAYSGSDAVTDFVAPADGDYLVRLVQFTYTPGGQIPGGLPPGSTDFTYRLTISTAPWIDAVVPCVVEPGKPTTLTVYGRNLPGGKPDPQAKGEDGVLEVMTMPFTPPADCKGKLQFSGAVQPAAGWQDGVELRVRNEAGASNPYLLGLARAPVVLEAANNDTPEAAQPVQLPCEIAGRVEKRRDRDWYSFTAKRGETWTFEVISNRLGAPTYMTMVLRDPATKNEFYESPSNENMNQYSAAFFSRSEDPPAYRFTAQKDGTYQLLVASRAGDSVYGSRHTYAVRITKDEPDFRLIAISSAADTPDAPTVPAGGQEAFTVLVDRSESFAEDVELTVEGLPAGVTCPPQVLNAAMKTTTLVLSAAKDVAPWVGEVRIKGTATVNGAKVVREARPASIVWPNQPNQNTPNVSRLDRAAWVSVRGKAPFTLSPTIDKASLAQGDKATVKIKADRLWPDLKTPIQVSLMQPQNRPGSEVPNNLRFNNNQPVTINPGQAEVAVPVTVGNDVPPGVYNVVFRGQTQAPYSKDPAAKAKPNTFIVQPSAALAVTVVPKALAQLTLSTTQATVKSGGQVEVVVRVQRRFNYQGEFVVQLVRPEGVTGVEAGEVRIGPGQTEAKLVLRSPADAKPGPRNNLVVKATALFNGKVPTVHEAKLNVNVVK